MDSLNILRALVHVVVLCGSTAVAGVLAPARVEKITPQTGGKFGHTFATDGAVTAVVTGGAEGLNTGKGRRVIVYRRSGTTWNVVATLSDPAGYGRTYGAAVALSGDSLAVGAPFAGLLRDPGITGSYLDGIYGRVYLYRRSGSGLAERWVADGILEPSATEIPEAGQRRFFGSRVQIAGDTVGAGNLGITLRLYRRTGTAVWTPGPVITEPDDSGGGPVLARDFNAWSAYFRMQGDLLVAGPHAGPGNVSQLLVYARNQGGTNAWGLEQRINVPAAAGGLQHQFPGGFAVSGNIIVARLLRSGTILDYLSGAQAYAGYAVYERTAAGAPFSQVYSSLATVPVAEAALMADAGYELPPVALAGTVAAIMSIDTETSLIRVQTHARAASGWSAGVRRTLNAGRARDSGNAPDLSVSGTSVQAGASYGAAETAHSRGLISEFAGVADSVFAPLLITVRPPEAPGTATFGTPLTAMGDYLLAGDPGDAEGAADSGAVHFWRRLAGSGLDYWTPEIVAKAPVPTEDARFGAAVAIRPGSDLMLFAGEPGHATGGRVHVLNRWHEEQWRPLIPGLANVTAGDQFGAALAVTDNYLFVGMPGDDTGGTNSGSVAVFFRPTGALVWDFQRLLPRPLSVSAGDAFGSAMSLDGDTLVVSAPYDEDADGDNWDGSVFVYSRNQGGAGNWGLVTSAPIRPGDTTRGIFGWSVAVRGDELLVGAWPFALFGVGRGEVFAFSRNSGGLEAWGLVTPLYESGFGTNSGFGVSVALSGDGRLALAGGNFDDAGALNRGLVHCFDRDRGGTRNWQLTSSEGPWEPETEDRLGQAVAAADDYSALAAPGDDTAGENAGAIYLLRTGSYERWACDTGLVGARLMPPAGDYDSDGVPNLTEFAIGSNPRSPASRTGGLTFTRESDGLLHLRLTKPLYDVTGLSYAGQFTTRTETILPGLGTPYTFLREWAAGTTVTDTASLLHVRQDSATSASPLCLGRLRLQYP